jgi:hypothetical protein
MINRNIILIRRCSSPSSRDSLSTPGSRKKKWENTIGKELELYKRLKTTSSETLGEAIVLEPSDQTRVSQFQEKNKQVNLVSSLSWWYPKSGNSVPELPFEIWTHIFSFLSLEDRCIASAASTEWNQISWLGLTKLEFRFRNRADQEMIMTNILSRCTRLRELVLRDCFMVSGRILRELPSSLQRFAFYNCPNFSKTVTNEDVKQLPDLISLRLHGCHRLDDDAVNYLPRTLCHVNLAESNMTDLATFVFPPELETLNLTGTVYPFKSLEGLPRKLKRLTLRNSSITAESLIGLPPHITSLDIGECRLLTDEALMHLNQLHDLVELRLDNCIGIQGTHFSFLPPQLRVLDLRNCARLDAENLRFLPKKITSLNLWGFHLSQHVLPALAKHFHLSELNLALSNISDVDFALTPLPPALTRLTLFGCKLISDEWLSKFSASHTHLQELDVGFTAVGDRTLYQLQEKFPSLQKICLPNTAVTKDALSLLQNSNLGSALRVYKTSQVC